MFFEFDRLEVLRLINFFKPVIPKKNDSKRSCLFVRVDEGKLVFTGGGQFVIKKYVLESANTTAEKGEIQKKFMIPRAALVSFGKMVEEHKAHCTKMAKTDESYLLVTIGDKELVSLKEKIDFEQPTFDFNDDIESDFQITKGSVSEIPMIPTDLASAMAGFGKIQPVEITFTGSMKPVHFKQGDYEAIVTPPIEKAEEPAGGEQISTDGDK